MTAIPAATEPRRALVEVQDLEVHFRVRRGISRNPAVVRAVDGVDLTIRRGETLGLVGESGCGKSTLARAVLRLTEPTRGRLTFDGIDLLALGEEEMRRMRRRMQIIFQDPYGSLNPRMTIGQTLTEPMRVHGIASGHAAVERMRDLLEAVGLPEDAAGRYPHEFSGGQQQRAAIGRALTLEPELVIADEAVSALDVSIRAQILNLMAELQDQFGLTYLFIAHDLAIVRHVSDRIAVMYLGRIVELADADHIHTLPLHPYTRALVSAIPVPDPVVEKERSRIILEGDVPSPFRPPSGCRFHSRCWLRRELGRPERCADEEPELRLVGDRGLVACHFAEELLDGLAAAGAEGSRGDAPGRKADDASGPPEGMSDTSPTSSSGDMGDEEGLGSQERS